MIVLRAKLNEKKRTYRDIAVQENRTSLYKIAAYVCASYGFAFDHCFGFFASPDIYGKGKDQVHYELFYDIGEEIDELTNSVEQTKASQLFKNKKDKWWMLFDYGDEWIFEIECVATGVSGYKSGHVLKSSGESPEQYPDWE